MRAPTKHVTDNQDVCVTHRDSDPNFHCAFQSQLSACRKNASDEIPIIVFGAGVDCAPEVCDLFNEDFFYLLLQRLTWEMHLDHP
jgi:hypothetical protein